MPTVCIGIQLFEHGYGLIPPVGKFSQGCSPRLIFPKGGVAHNHDQRVGYPAYTTVIQLQPAALCNVLRTTHRS